MLTLAKPGLCEAPMPRHRCGRAFAGLIPQEYRSAAYALRGVASPKAVFLRCYATFLAGEKRKE